MSISFGSINPMSLASTALGPAGFGAQLASNLMASIGRQVIGQLGQQLGLPQSAIDMAQGAFSASSGDFKGAVRNYEQAAQDFAQGNGASSVEQGDFSRQVTDAINKLVSSLAEGDDMKAAKSGGGKGGGSWLMHLAEVLGKKLDKMASDMNSMADQITDSSPSMTAKFGAKSQEFGILMNAATNAIKTVGEAEANSARKS